jgi:hypothetical protein
MLHNNGLQSIQCCVTEFMAKGRGHHASQQQPSVHSVLCDRVHGLGTRAPSFTTKAFSPFSVVWMTLVARMAALQAEQRREAQWHPRVQNSVRKRAPYRDSLRHCLTPPLNQIRDDQEAGAVEAFSPFSGVRGSVYG